MILEKIEENNFFIDPSDKELILSKLERLIQNQNLDIDDILIHLEEHYLNTNEKILNLKVMEKIENDILFKKNASSNFKSNTKKTTSFPPSIEKNIKNNMMFQNIPKTVMDNAFISRGEKKNIFFSYNDMLHNQNVSRYKGNNYSKEMLIKPKLSKFNDFLNCPLICQSQALQKHYHSLKEAFETFLKEKNKDFEKFEDVTYLPNKKILSFLRVLCDGDGKLNEKSVLADFPELSFKIYLDLNEIPNIILFPNQCIAVEGVFLDDNADKKVITAEKIYTEPYEKKQQPDDDIENKYEKNKAKKIKIENNTMIIAAAGPFTLPDSVSYTPLLELLNEVKNLMPDYLFLLGPFVDKGNQVVQTGLIEISNQFFSYEDLFEQIILLILEEIGDKTEIFLIPSTDDITNIYPVPQEPFNFSNGRVFPKNIHIVTNPCSLEYDGEISFEVFNSPVIDDLRAQSLFKIPLSHNRIDACLQQIVNQRTLAPIYPLSQPLDLRKYDLLQISEAPNFIIIPSNIGSGFAKIIGETIFVNPGFVCKNEGCRTYAQIVIYDDSSIKVENRTRVDIVYL